MTIHILTIPERLSDPQNKIYLLLGDVLSLLSKKSITTEKSESTILPSDNLVAQALNYINLHYNTIQSLDEIASALFITKCHLCRIFKDTTSTTVNQYLTSLRLKHARELLISTSMNIAQISSKCGFNSPIYFTQCFKKQFAMAPITYREKNQQMDEK